VNAAQLVFGNAIWATEVVRLSRFERIRLWRVTQILEYIVDFVLRKYSISHAPIIDTASQKLQGQVILAQIGLVRGTLKV
jgi:hypothetical protein